MNEGAFALLDCLGFRGIWNRANPEKLIELLQSAEKKAQSAVVPQLSSKHLSFGPVRVRVSLLSDTVALSVQYQPEAYENGKTPDERQKNLLVSVACESAARLAELFISNEVMPLPLRGCISFGEHICEGNFLIGPAVDQAAEYMNEPEGAFIWLLPDVIKRHKSFLERSAMIMSLAEKDQKIHALAADRLADIFQSTIEENDEVGSIKAARASDLLRSLAKNSDEGLQEIIKSMSTTFAQLLNVPNVVENYPMPIKRGAIFEAAVINPFMVALTDTDCKRIRKGYEDFLEGNRIDIWIKRQNTLKFLDQAEEESNAYRTNTAPLLTAAMQTFNEKST